METQKVPKMKSRTKKLNNMADWEKPKSVLNEAWVARMRVIIVSRMRAPRMVFFLPILWAITPLGIAKRA